MLFPAVPSVVLGGQCQRALSWSPDRQLEAFSVPAAPILSLLFKLTFMAYV